MGRKALMAVLCWIALNEAAANAVQAANSVGPIDNVSAESAPPLYRNIPFGVYSYASASPHAAFSFHVPQYVTPNFNHIIPMNQERILAQSTNNYLKDSYGQRFVEAPQAYAYKPALQQQFLPLQKLPAHLSQPLLAASPNAQYGQATHFFGAPFRLANLQTIPTQNGNPFGAPQPLVYAQNVRPLASPAPKQANVQPASQQQSTSDNNNVYANIYAAGQFNQFWKEPKTQIKQEEPKNSASDIKENQEIVQSLPLVHAPKQTTITSFNNGKKTVVNLITKPPVPLLDLTLLEPLTFDNPLVPQVQHFLPKIHSVTYQKLPELNLKNDQKVITIKRKTTKKTKKQKKPKIVKDEVEVSHTPSKSSDDNTEITYEINGSPNYKETISEKKVSYNKETTSKPVVISYEKKTEMKPVTYSYGKHVQQEPVHYNYVHNSNEPAKVKQAYLDDNKEKTKHLIYHFTPEEQSEEEQNEKSLNSVPDVESVEIFEEEPNENQSEEETPQQQQHLQYQEPQHKQHQHQQQQYQPIQHKHQPHQSLNHHLQHQQHNEPQQHHHQHHQQYEQQQYHQYKPHNHEHHQQHEHQKNEPQQHQKYEQQQYHQYKPHNHEHHQQHEPQKNEPQQHQKYEQQHIEQHQNHVPQQQHQNHFPQQQHQQQKQHVPQQQIHDNAQHELAEEAYNEHNQNFREEPEPEHREVAYYQNSKENFEPKHREEVYYPNSKHAHIESREESPEPIVHKLSPQQEKQYEPIVPEYEEDITILPAHKPHAPIHAEENSNRGSNDKHNSHPESHSEQVQYDYPKSYYSYPPLPQEKSNRIIVKDNPPKKKEEVYTPNEELLEAMVKKQEESEEDFEQAYKDAAYGFDAYDTPVRNADREKEIYNPANYGVPRYHNDFDEEKSQLRQYEPEGDEYPAQVRSNYKDARDKTNDDYYTDYSASRPQSIVEGKQKKAEYYDNYNEHKPQGYYAKDDSDKQQSAKYTVGPAYSYPGTPQQQFAKFTSRITPLDEYNYAKEAPTPIDNSAFGTGTYTSKIQYLEPRYQYGFEPIRVSRLLDRELAAMASDHSPETVKKMYKEKFYLEKSSSSNGEKSTS